MQLSPMYICTTACGGRVETHSRRCAEILRAEGMAVEESDLLLPKQRDELLSIAATTRNEIMLQYPPEYWPALSAWRAHGVANKAVKKISRSSLQADLRKPIVGSRGSYDGATDSLCIVLTTMGDDHRGRIAIERCRLVCGELGASLVVVSIESEPPGGNAMFRPSGETAIRVQNKGFASACNAGLDQVGPARWVIFTQSDVVFTADAVRTAIAIAKSTGNEKPACVGPSGGVVESFMGARVVEAGRNIGQIASRPQLVDWVAGYWLLCDAQCARDVGGFDDGYFLYYEDVDFTLRLAMHGCRPVVVSALSVDHARGHATTIELPHAAREAIRFESSVRFTLSWCP